MAVRFRWGRCTQRSGGNAKMPNVSAGASLRPRNRLQEFRARRRNRHREKAEWTPLQYEAGTSNCRASLNVARRYRRKSESRLRRYSHRRRIPEKLRRRRLLTETFWLSCIDPRQLADSSRGSRSSFDAGRPPHAAVVVDSVDRPPSITGPDDLDPDNPVSSATERP